MIVPIESQVYGGRRNGEPLPGSYLNQIEPPAAQSLPEPRIGAPRPSAQAKSPGHARALIQEAAGAIRNSEDG